LLSNQGIEVDAFFARWVPHLLAARTEVLIALDWTVFEKGKQQTLMLSMLTGHGRATPLMWRTVELKTLKGHQSEHENSLLRGLREVVPAGVKVTVVADRGFNGCEFLSMLSEELRFDYVVRLDDHFYVTSAEGERRKASAWVGARGRARTLRNALLTDAHSMPVATIVCVQEKDMKGVWCLVASDGAAKAATLINYYGKRWGIETSFRDIKDLRFGMGMLELHIKNPARRDRLLLLSALAIALLSMLGAAGEAIGYDRWLKTNTAKHRTISLFRQGVMLYNHLSNWSDDRVRPLMDKFAELLYEQPLYRDIFAVI
jgi:hypothetical protein